MNLLLFLANGIEIDCMSNTFQILKYKSVKPLIYKIFNAIQLKDYKKLIHDLTKSLHLTVEHQI